MHKSFVGIFGICIACFMLIFMTGVSPVGTLQQVSAQSGYPLGPYGTVSWNGIAVLPTTTATLTPNQMVGLGAGALSGAATYTTPSATALCSLWPFVGSSNAASFNWDWFVRDTAAGSNSITVAAGSGVTVSGTATVAQNNIKHFKVNVTGCGGTPAAVVYSLGTSVF